VSGVICVGSAFAGCGEASEPVLEEPNKDVPFLGVDGEFTSDPLALECPDDPRNPGRVVLEKMEKMSFYEDREGTKALAEGCTYEYASFEADPHYYPEYPTLARGSFDVEVVHYTPAEVQYSCIADGAAAATGASLGKLNLGLETGPAEATRTLYRRRSTGQSVVLRVTEAFKARFEDVPRERLGDAGREVLALRDDEIFEVVP
jgi:hypothetical protein